METTLEPILATAPLSRSVEVAGHTLDIFTEWPHLAARLVPDIAAAKKRIWMEVYIFHNDTGGQAVADALIERARAGLDVRLLVDAVGSGRTPAAFFTAMSDAGIKVHLFHTFWEALEKLSPLKMFNRRNHRKLVVIDDAVGYFGGMNVIDNNDAPTPLEAKHGLPMSAGWRDVHVRIAGPQIPQLADSFQRSWDLAQGRKVGRRPRLLRRPAVNDLGDAIHFYDSGPGLRYSRAPRVFTALLRRARSQVMLSMAYFVPIGAVLRALLRARKRGVRMRIIIPGKSDVSLVQRATTHLYKMLLRRGFRIYERQDRMLHSKVMVVDSQWTLIGSCNFDPRSLFTNLEFLGVIRSEALAKVIEEVCREEIGGSKVVRISHCGRLGWWDRFFNRMAWGLRRLL